MARRGPAAITPPAYVTIGAYPGVGLLPPSVQEEHAVRELRRRLLLLPLVALLVVALGLAWTLVASQRATAQVEAARDERARLTAELEKFRDVTAAQEQVTKLEGSTATLMAGEIAWFRVFTAIELALPPGTTITDLQRDGNPGEAPSVTEAEPGIEGAAEAVGAVTIAATAPALPDVSALLDSLDASDLLTGATYTMVSADPEAGYAFQVTIYLEKSALTGRWAKPAEDGGATAASPEPATTDEVQQ